MPFDNLGDRVAGKVAPARLILGLGNPGREYAHSRHNVGFVVVEALAHKHGLKWEHRWSQARVAVGRIAGVEVALGRPQTFMNRSGSAARGLLGRFGLTAADLLVVYDDLDLPLGRLRLRDRGSAGGHRGVQSIVDRLGTDAFGRLKIGIGRPEPADAIDYVLGEFPPAEREQVGEVVERAVAAVELYLSAGLTPAMNQFNR